MKLVREWSGEQARKLRMARNQNQQAFWAMFHVTQSGGSRYESGRPIPEPVQALMTIGCGTELQSTETIARVRG